MKCTVAAKYFVQHRSECKYVTARVGGLAAHLLWRHVTRGSEHQSGRRVGTRQRSAIGCGAHSRLFGKAKIQNLDPSIARHKDVFRLNIAMHNAFFMCARETLRYLYAVIDRLALRQRTVFQKLPQRFAFKQFRNHEWRPIVLPDVEYRENVGMVQRRDCASFGFKPLQSIVFAGKGFRQNLERDVAAQAGIESGVNLAHSP